MKRYIFLILLLIPSLAFSQFAGRWKSGANAGTATHDIIKVDTLEEKTSGHGIVFKSDAKMLGNLVLELSASEALTVNGKLVVRDSARVVGTTRLVGTVTAGATATPAYISSGGLGAFGGVAINTAYSMYVGSTGVGSPRGVVSRQSSATAGGASFSLKKSRGTLTAGTIITTADTLGTLNFWGADANEHFVKSAQISALSTGTIASTRIPSILTFATGTNAAPTVLTERMRISETGAVIVQDSARISSTDDKILFTPKAATTAMMTLNAATAGNVTGLKFTGAAFNDASDYWIYGSTTNYWNSGGSLQLSSSLTMGSNTDRILSLSSTTRLRLVDDTSIRYVDISNGSSGTQWATFDGDNKFVGIGTMGPQHKLSVVDPTSPIINIVNSTTNKLRTSVAQSEDTTSITIDASGTQMAINFANATGQKQQIASTASDQIAFTGASGGVVVGDAATYDPIVISPTAKGANAFTGTVTTTGDLTANRTYELPDYSGIHWITGTRFMRPYIICATNYTTIDLSDGDTNYILETGLGPITYREEQDKTIRSVINVATGISIDGDNTVNNEGVEFLFADGTGSGLGDGWIITGTTGATFLVEFTIADISATDQLLIGFRSCVAFDASNDYTNYVEHILLGITATDGSIFASSRVPAIAVGAQQTDDSGTNITDATSHTLQVTINASTRVPTAFLDGVAVTLTNCGGARTTATAMAPIITYMHGAEVADPGIVINRISIYR